MSKILIVAEHDGGRLNPATAKCVTCAKAIAGAEIVVAVFAADGAAVAAQAAQIAGVTRVLRVDHAANQQAVAACSRPRWCRWPKASPTCSARRPPSART
jgi:electron transfer flavoprotein alpha subunit